MELTAQQIAYLVSLGMAEGASDAQMHAFVATMGAAQVKFINGLKTAAGGAEDAGTRGRGDAGTATPATATPATASPTATQTASQTPVQPAAAATLPTDLDARIAAAQAASQSTERNRAKHIRGVAAQLGLGEAWVQQQIDGGYTVDQVNGAALTQAAANRPPISMGTPNVQVGVDRHGAAVAQGLVDAYLGRIGGALLEIDPASGMPVAGRTRQPHAMAAQFRGNSLMMAQTFLGLCGRSTAGMSAPQICQAVFLSGPRVNFTGSAGAGGMTSADFPYLLANALGVSIQQHYVAYPSQWPLFAIEAPAGDFRQQSLVQIGPMPVLPEVKEGGEYTYVQFGEDREVWSLTKRGHIVSLSWEMVLNDELAAFGQITAMQGDAAARTDDTLAFAVLTGNPTMGDGGALFNATAVTTAAGHANLVAHGSGAAPSVTTLNTMDASFGAQPAVRKAVTDTAVYTNLEPGVLLVPRALKATALALVNDQWDPAGVAPRPYNPWYQRLTLASHRLLDASDAKQWYVCTKPSFAPAMVLGYLDGMRGPQLTQQSGFDRDTRDYKVMHVRTAKATDYRLWYCNNGD